MSFGKKIKSRTEKIMRSTLFYSRFNKLCICIKSFRFFFSFSDKTYNKVFLENKAGTH